jgi:adenylate kinase family enzyme
LLLLKSGLSSDYERPRLIRAIQRLGFVSDAQARELDVETVRKRLEIYHSQTSPLIDFYQHMSSDDAPAYHRIDGVGSVDEIKEKVLRALGG